MTPFITSSSMDLLIPVRFTISLDTPFSPNVFKSATRCFTSVFAKYRVAAELAFVNALRNKTGDILFSLAKFSNSFGRPFFGILRLTRLTEFSEMCKSFVMKMSEFSEEIESASTYSKLKLRPWLNWTARSVQN